METPAFANAQKILARLRELEVLHRKERKEKIFSKVIWFSVHWVLCVLCG